MSTRSQNIKYKYQENPERVCEKLVTPVLVHIVDLSEQNVMIAGTSITNSPRVENSVLESLRASLKKEITSEIKGLVMEFQRGVLKLLKPRTG